MKSKTRFLKYILTNLDNIMFNNVTNKVLYKDLCIISNYLSDKKIEKLFLLTNTSEYNKFLFILATLYNNLIVNIIDKDFIMNNNHNIFDNDKINHVLSEKNFVHISINNNMGSIVYNLNKSEKIILNWDKINEFYNSSKNFLKKYIKKKEFSIPNLNNIYYSYFIGYIVYEFYTVKLNLINPTINDQYNQSSNIFICHKYTLNSDNKYNLILFFSYNLSRFLLYDVKINSSRIQGNIFSYFTLKKMNNKQILIYKKQFIDLPNTYTILSNNLLKINKKKTKIITLKKFNNIQTINVNSFNYFFIKHSFIKRVFLNSNISLSKADGYKIYLSLLKTFPEINSKQYKQDFKNFYLYNQYILLDNILFSMILINDNNKTSFILDISLSIYYLESDIIEKIDELISILVNLDNIKIKEQIIKNNSIYLYDKIHILSEIKAFFYILKHMYLVINLFLNRTSNINTNSQEKNITQQVSYRFDKKEINLIRDASVSLNTDYYALFRALLFRSLLKLFPNKTIIYLNKSGLYIIPNILEENIHKFIDKINILLRAKVSQTFFSSFIFKILNSLKYIDKYDNLFIIVQENKDKKFIYNNIHLNKINTNNRINLFSSHLNYNISKSDISVNLSFLSTFDQIKYAILDILNI